MKINSTNKNGKLKYEQQVKWFTDRIGKRVFMSNYPRLDTKMYKNGVVIKDSDTALYLLDTCIDLGIKYFDTEEGRNIYEKENK